MVGGCCRWRNGGFNMSQTNVVRLSGNLGDNPIIRYTPGGDPVVGFRLAARAGGKNSGVMVEQTAWHRCLAHGPLADKAMRDLKKGSRVYVVGEAHDRIWKDRAGREHAVTEVHIKEFQVFGADTDDSSQAGEEASIRVRSPIEAAMAAGLFKSESD